MLKNIIISITLLLCTNSLCAQYSTDSVLLSLEKQIYATTNDTLKAELLLQKTAIYFNQNISDSLLLIETDRLNWHLLKDSLAISNYLWNAALANTLNKRYYRAENYFTQYQLLNKTDTSLTTQLLSAVILMTIDSTKLSNVLTRISKKDSSFEDLSCYQSVIEYHKKGKALYMISSTIVPGSGMFALGKPKQGTASLLLNAGTAYAVYALVQNNLYFNAITWGIMLTQKFYLGGIRLTDKLFTEKEEKNRYELSNECEEKLKELLKKYPLTCKF